MARIAVGGFQHETNTFAPVKATYADFREGGGWPALKRGAEVVRDMVGMNLPIAGAIPELKAKGHELVGLVWCATTPCAHVTEDAYERIAAAMLEELGPVDAVYLDLHGAMVTEHLEDGEGELLRRVRAKVGRDVPIVASLDLHSNTTPEMVEQSDALVAYRHYPHTDMAETGARAARALDALLRGDGVRHKAFRQGEFLIPIIAQCTMMEPTAPIYDELRRIEAETGVLPSFTPGFPAADIHHCGPAVMAYGKSAAAADEAADRLIGLVAANEQRFFERIYTPDEGVTTAMALAARASKPVVLADAQDNPGAGGTSDTVGLLEALVRHDADAVMAIVADGASARAAHEAGTGATIELGLGGKTMPGDTPFRGRFTVERLGDGSFTGTGPMWRGVPCRLGRMALLRTGRVRVIVAEKKLQAADQAIFRHLGVEPSREKILALKSSVHFRADFQPIAEQVLVVAAPGAFPVDPTELPWTRLRAGIKRRPDQVSR